MPEIHPDNHPNDPFFPRQFYADAQQILDATLMDVEKKRSERRIFPHQQVTLDELGGLAPAVEDEEEWVETKEDRERYAYANIASHIRQYRSLLMPEEFEHVVDQKPLFIEFAGGEGSGKSTQSKKLYEYLKRCKVPVYWTREPGATDLGNRMRRILLDHKKAPKSKLAELFGFAMDRAEHVETVIRPKLAEGYVVLCDRYSASTVAYQAYANGLDLDTVKYICDIASTGLEPDRVIYLDVEPEVGLERAGRINRTRFEDMTLEYHKKVRRGFKLQVNRKTWLELDSTKNDINKLHLLIRNNVFQLCKEYGYLPELPSD
jgi:dTMP kinase